MSRFARGKSFYTFFFLTFVFTVYFNNPLHPEGHSSEVKQLQKQISLENSFTGVITGNSVRLRLHPSVTSPILREFDRDQLILVEGESDDFYRVSGRGLLKGYIFRSYVIDNIVEASHLHIRDEPSTEGVILGKLSQGEEVSATVCSYNSKWLEIELPQEISFYISKDFVQKYGEASIAINYYKKRSLFEKLFAAANFLVDQELSLNYQEIEYPKIQNTFESLLAQYEEIEDLKSTITSAYKRAQESFLKKKMHYLEEQTQVTKNELEDYQKPIVDHKSSNNFSEPDRDSNPTQLNLWMSNYWLDVENSLFKKWLITNPDQTLHDFYYRERQRSIALTGKLESYRYLMQSRPGDYLLRDQYGVPLAYLYSTS